MINLNQTNTNATTIDTRCKNLAGLRLVSYKVRTKEDALKAKVFEGFDIVRVFKENHIIGDLRKMVYDVVLDEIAYISENALIDTVGAVEAFEKSLTVTQSDVLDGKLNVTGFNPFILSEYLVGIGIEHETVSKFVTDILCAIDFVRQTEIKPVEHLACSHSVLAFLHVQDLCSNDFIKKAYQEYLYAQEVGASLVDEFPDVVEKFFTAFLICSYGLKTTTAKKLFELFKA